MRATHMLLLLFLLSTLSARAASLSDLDFMTGRWVNSASGDVIEEWWMAAEADTKVAAFRWASGGRIVAIELVVISQEQDGIFLRFKHFGADYVPWEKDAPNVYRLEGVEDNKATFVRVSTNDKVPNAMIYSRNDDQLEFRGTNNASGPPSDADLILRFHLAGAEARTDNANR